MKVFAALLIAMLLFALIYMTASWTRFSWSTAETKADRRATILTALFFFFIEASELVLLVYGMFLIK